MHSRDDAGAAVPGLMREVIGQIATGPEYSRDLSFETARSAMAMVLDGRADPVQSAVFLVALRMKRESDDENLGLLAALQAASEPAIVTAREVVDVAEPYDGYAKGLPVTPFLPALLAACDVPAVCHGCWSMGPKHGLSAAQVLAACGYETHLRPQRAAAVLDSAGWAYVDQAHHCPALHALAPLRELIVKRPALSTLEKLLRPLRGSQRTHLLTGYVHKAYPRVYALLAKAAGFDSALLVRGMEGGVLPSLRQPGKALRYAGGADAPMEILKLDPAEADIRQTLRMSPLPAVHDRHAVDTRPPTPSAANAELVAHAADAGVAALHGRAGVTRDALVYGAAMVLWHVGRADSLRAGATRARVALDSGAAHDCFERGCAGARE